MSDVLVKRFTSKMLGANTYVVYSGKSAVIIDPCVEINIVKTFCSKNAIVPELIILTHAHIDHIVYLGIYKNEFEIKTAIHADDNDALSDKYLNGAVLFGMDETFESADILLKDKDTIAFNGKILKIISTPGHTPGSICINIDEMLFSGDTLFYMSVGRTDLGRGDSDALLKSLNEKLFILPEDTIVYPGHGTTTTIKYEKENNPFIY